MTADQFSDEQIRLLLRHGKITHIVRASGDARMTPLTLVQRCFSANIDFAVPLPDGTAAIFAPNGVPASLAVFGIEARPVRAAAPGRGSGTLSGTLDELEEMLSDRPSPPAPDEEDGSAPAGDPGPEDTLETRLAGLSAALDALPDRLAERVGAPSDALDALRAAVEALGNEAKPAAAQDDGAAVLDRLDAIEARIAALAEPDGGGAEDEAKERLDRIEAAIARIAGEAEGAAKADAARGAALERIDKAIVGLATRPAPRPDLTALNGMMARFNTALSAAVARLETAADTFESAAAAGAPEAPSAELAALSEKLDALLDQSAASPDASTAAGDGLPAAIEAGFATLADALREGPTRALPGAESPAAPAPAAAAPDPHPELSETLLRQVGELSDLQHTVIRQLSALMDSRDAAGRAAQEEFLVDLRHTIAELIADQKRTATAG